MKSIKMITFVKPKDALSKEEFVTKWLNEHAPIAKQMKKTRKYIINICVDDFTADLPYIGTAELYWDSKEDMDEDISSEMGQLAAENANTFMESINLYTQEYLIK